MTPDLADIPRNRKGIEVWSDYYDEHRPVTARTVYLRMQWLSLPESILCIFPTDHSAITIRDLMLAGF